MADHPPPSSNPPKKPPEVPDLPPLNRNASQAGLSEHAVHQLPQVHQQILPDLQAPPRPTPPPPLQRQLTMPPLPLPISPTTGEPLLRRDSKKKRMDSSGCEKPFVPASVTSSIAKFKQLSTRRKEIRAMQAQKNRSAASVGSKPHHGLVVAVSASHEEGPAVSTPPPTGVTTTAPCSPYPFPVQPSSSSSYFPMPPTSAPAMPSQDVMDSFLSDLPSIDYPTLKATETTRPTYVHQEQPVPPPPPSPPPVRVRPSKPQAPAPPYPGPATAPTHSTMPAPLPEPVPEQAPMLPPAPEPALRSSPPSSAALPASVPMVTSTTHPITSAPATTTATLANSQNRQQNGVSVQNSLSQSEQQANNTSGIGFTLTSPSMTKIEVPPCPSQTSEQPGTNGVAMGSPPGQFGYPSTPRASVSGQGQYLDPAQWTVVDGVKDHPGMRRNSGFFQPIRHLSGRKSTFLFFCQKNHLLLNEWPFRGPSKDNYITNDKTCNKGLTARPMMMMISPPDRDLSNHANPPLTALESQAEILWW